MFRLLFLILIMASAPLHAEEKSLEVWLEELAESYGDLWSFLATYTGDQEGGHLTATIGSDSLSGRIVIHAIAVKDDKPFEVRIWNDAEGTLFLDQAGERLRFPALRRTLDLLNSFSVISTDRGGGAFITPLALQPSFLLSGEGFVPSFYVPKGGEGAGWMVHCKLRKVVGFSETSVEFETAKSGTLKVSRASGIVEAQSVAGDDGVLRVLKLKELRRDPGVAAIEELCSEWSTLGAKDAGLRPILGAGMGNFFQSVIEAIEAGGADLGKLEDHLEKKEDEMRACLKAWAIDGEPSSLDRIPWKDNWKRLSESMRDEWKKDHPGSTDLDFENYLKKSETRRSFAKSAAKPVLSDPRALAMVLSDILPGGPEALHAENEAGEAAKQKIERAIAMAYLEAFIERKMTQLWDDWDDWDELD